MNYVLPQTAIYCCRCTLAKVMALCFTFVNGANRKERWIVGGRMQIGCVLDADDMCANADGKADPHLCVRYYK